MTSPSPCLVEGVPGSGCPPRLNSLKRQGEHSLIGVLSLHEEQHQQPTVQKHQHLLLTQLEAALQRGFQKLNSSHPQECRPHKRARVNGGSTSPLTSRLVSINTKTMPRNASCPSFPALAKSCRLAPLPASKVVVIQGPRSATARTQESTQKSDSKYSDTNPELFLKSILESNGYSTTPVDSLSTENFFLEMTSNNLSGYGSEMIQAVRQENIPELRELRRNGMTMQCCNRFGESIVHMACRRGSEKVLKFLMEEAQVSMSS